MDEMIRKQDAVDALTTYIYNVCKGMNKQMSIDRCEVAAKSVIGELPPVQPTIMRSIGELVGYTGEPCPNCGRLRVERYESGLEICEKCNWCEQTKSYWLDGV